VTPAAAPARPGSAGARITRLLELRAHLAAEWFPARADAIARLCHQIARRFNLGGRLLAIGDTAAARSDVKHVVVEFVHPVIVGKRALPAIGLGDTLDDVTRDVELLATSSDVLLAFGSAPQLAAAVRVARERGCLTVGFADICADWTFDPPSADPFVRQELVETLYHVLWELVHVFFEHRGLLSDESLPTTSNGGAASFLYPFLSNAERDLEGVLADVARSVVAKANDVIHLRGATMKGQEPILASARSLRSRLDAGSKVLAFGNGGSSTDAMDAVADLRSPPAGLCSRPAIDLSSDAAVLTALANDIGADSLFSRQIIAHGRAGDVAIAFSTSGNSRNIVRALEEAKRRHLVSIAFVGYDGGEIRAKQLADHLVISPSQYIPRIQEAQAAAWHIVRELVEDDSLLGDASEPADTIDA